MHYSISSKVLNFSRDFGTSHRPMRQGFTFSMADISKQIILNSHEYNRQLLLQSITTELIRSIVKVLFHILYPQL